MSFMMANATASTRDAMVQTEWRSPTGSALTTVSGCKARFVLHDQRVKNSPLHNHGDQQAEIIVHRAKIQLKSRAATFTFYSLLSITLFILLLDLKYKFAYT